MAKSDEVEGMDTLSTRQVSELFLYFKHYIISKRLESDSFVEHFLPGTETFVEFILDLEEQLRWFDYTQAVEMIEILDLYLHTLENERKHDEQN